MGCGASAAKKCEAEKVKLQIESQNHNQGKAELEAKLQDTIEKHDQEKSELKAEITDAKGAVQFTHHNHNLEKAEPEAELRDAHNNNNLQRAEMEAKLQNAIRNHEKEKYAREVELATAKDGRQDAYHNYKAQLQNAIQNDENERPTWELATAKAGMCDQIAIFVDGCVSGELLAKVWVPLDALGKALRIAVQEKTGKRIKILMGDMELDEALTISASGLHDGDHVSAAVMKVNPKCLQNDLIKRPIELKLDGSVVDHSNNQVIVEGGVQHVCAIGQGFAALKEDGSVITWGYHVAGCHGMSVEPQLKDDVQYLCSTYSGIKGHPFSGDHIKGSGAFAAVKADGSIITWGTDSTSKDDLLAAHEKASHWMSMRGGV